jgi:hypothetical protein
VARIYRNSLGDPLTVIEQAVPVEFAGQGPEWRQVSLPKQPG